MSLPWARLVLRNIRKRNFHTTKCSSLFHESPDKDGYLQKSNEEKQWEKLSTRERAIIELKLFTNGVKQWTEEFKENINKGQRISIGEHEVDIVWRFKGDPKELQEWAINTDKDHNLGFSTAQLDLTPESKGLFHGFLDTKVPPNGEIKRTGYCNLRMLPRLSPFKNVKKFDWQIYTHIVFRVRGDGRVYSVNLHLETGFDVTSYDTYHYFIWTRGGPYWQYVRIPFSKFFFAYKGRLQAKNMILAQHQVGAVSFTIADKVTGPFRFEIDYIGVEYDPSHIEETAYEQYTFDQKFW